MRVVMEVSVLISWARSWTRSEVGGEGVDIFPFEVLDSRLLDWWLVVGFVIDGQSLVDEE